MTLSTGLADPYLTNEVGLADNAPYAIRRGINMAVAKCNALCKKDGVLFIAISPGWWTLAT